MGVGDALVSSPPSPLFLHWGKLHLTNPGTRSRKLRKLVTIIPEDDVGVELAENVDPWTGREEIGDSS